MIAITLVARAAILHWGGPSFLGTGSGPSCPTVPAGRARGLASLLILALWSTFAVGPVAALLWRLTDSVLGATAGQWSGDQSRGCACLDRAIHSPRRT